MITEYFSTEELEHELREDYSALIKYIIIRETKLKLEIMRSRKNQIIRMLPWKSPKNNLWYFKEKITKRGAKYDIEHNNTFCLYKYHGKLRGMKIFSSNERDSDDELNFWHFSFHFFHRLKQRLNWKLSIEETAKKFMTSFQLGAVQNMTEKCENGSFPMTCISPFGLLMGVREINHPLHYWITTFLNTGILNKKQKELDQLIKADLDTLSKNWPEEFVEEYKQEVLDLISKFNQSAPNKLKRSKESKAEN